MVQLILILVVSFGFVQAADSQKEDFKKICERDGRAPTEREFERYLEQSRLSRLHGQRQANDFSSVARSPKVNFGLTEAEIEQQESLFKSFEKKKRLQEECAQLKQENNALKKEIRAYQKCLSGYSDNVPSDVNDYENPEGLYEDEPIAYQSRLARLEQEKKELQNEEGSFFGFNNRDTYENLSASSFYWPEEKPTEWDFDGNGSGQEDEDLSIALAIAMSLEEGN